MSTTMENTIAAFMGADEDRKAEALRVLRGEAEEKDKGKRMKDEVEPFLTLREVARRLGISVCSLWRYGVPSHDFAGRARFRMSEVEAHLRKLESEKLKVKSNGGRG